MPNFAYLASHGRRLATVSACATVLAALVAMSARPVAAQIIPDDVADEGGPSASAAAAYLALTLTPVGALASSADYLLARPGAAPRPLRLHGRFANIDRGDGVGQRTWAATLDMPVAAAALSLTAGYVDVNCDGLLEDSGADDSFDCKGGFTAGARVGSSFFSRSLDAAGTSALVVGAELTAGYADITAFEGDLLGASTSASAKALSGTFGVPIAITVHSGNVTVAPMLVPRFGYGRAKEVIDFLGDRTDDTFAGGRFMLGGSVMVRVGDRIGFDAGLQKVFIDQGDTAYGLGVSIGF